jgi:quercetin dioxygenase-like cupin family protein
MGTQDDSGDAREYFDLSDTGSNAAGSITPMDELASYEIADGLFFRPFFAESISLNFVTFPALSGFPAHVHPEEQISIVREGEMEITIGDTTRRVKPGDVIHFPPNVQHSGRTLEGSCRLIDIFSPPRTGIRDVIADADPVRAADVDRWWYDDDSVG